MALPNVALCLPMPPPHCSSTNLQWPCGLLFYSQGLGPKDILSPPRWLPCLPSPQEGLVSPGSSPKAKLDTVPPPRELQEYHHRREHGLIYSYLSLQQNSACKMLKRSFAKSSTLSVISKNLVNKWPATQTPLPVLLCCSTQLSFKINHCNNSFVNVFLPLILVSPTSSVHSQLLSSSNLCFLSRLPNTAVWYHFDQRSLFSVRQWVQFNNPVTFSSLVHFPSLRQLFWKLFWHRV